MINTIISSSNEYDIVSTDSGNVVSCIGNFSYSIVCIGEHYDDPTDNYKVLKTFHKVNIKQGESMVSSFTTDDFGPQRFCKVCGSRVHEFEPEVVKNEVHYWDFIKGNYFPGMRKPLMTVRHYKEEEVSGWKCDKCESNVLDTLDYSKFKTHADFVKYTSTLKDEERFQTKGMFLDSEVSSTSTIEQIEIMEIYEALKEADSPIDFLTDEDGTILINMFYLSKHKWNNNELEMEDIKKVFKNLKGKDAKWLHDNASIVKKIYKDHADDVGRKAKEECCVLDENISAINQEGDMLKTDGSMTLSNATQFSKESTEMSKEACAIFGTNNAKMGYNHSIVWKSMMYGKEFALKLLNEAIEHLTKEEYKYLLKLVEVDSLDNKVKNEFSIRNYGVRFIGNRYEFGKINVRNVSKTKYPKLVADKEIKKNSYLQSRYEFKSKAIQGILEDFANLKVKTIDSEKYIKKTTFYFNMKGKVITLVKGKTASNWFNPDKLEHKELNEAINWITGSYKKGMYISL
jgi:hypothetical protein